MHNSSKNQASFFKNRKCNSIEKKKSYWLHYQRVKISVFPQLHLFSFYIILIALDDSCCVVTSSAGPFWRPFFSFFPKLLLLLQFSTIFSHFCLRNSAFLYSLQMHIFSVISDDQKKREGCYEYLLKIVVNTFSAAWTWTLNCLIWNLP